MDEKELAKKFIKENKRKLLAYFVSGRNPIISKNPILICMAGSSGAGKTETAKSFMTHFEENIIRIDADDVKVWITENTKIDLNECHGASSLAVDIIYNHCRKKSYNCIIDGTFANFKISKENINRAIKRDFTIFIAHVYQHPKEAWDFIQKRTEKEGRKVPYKIFKKSFINSIENVSKIKEEFGNKVVIYSIEKNFDKEVNKFKLNISAPDLKKLLENVKIEYQNLK
jgi:predicted ABC-type ATPase